MPDNRDQQSGDEQFTDRIHREDLNEHDSTVEETQTAREAGAAGKSRSDAEDSADTSSGQPAESADGSDRTTRISSVSGDLGAASGTSATPDAAATENPPGAAPDGTGQHDAEPGFPETDAEQGTAEGFPRTDEDTGAEQDFPETDQERTEQLAALPSDFPNLAESTQSLPTVAMGTGGYGNAYGAAYGNDPSGQYRSDWNSAASPGGDSAATQPGSGRGGSGRRRGLIRGGIAAGAVVAVLALLYIVDLVVSSGTVPRGTVVAGVDIGGMQPTSAERELRTQLEPGLHEPISVRAGDNTATFDPESAGLRMDWQATVGEAGSQPLNPFTRVTSFFTTRDVDPVSAGDRDQLVDTIEEIKPQLDREAREGTIRFNGDSPEPVDPLTGREVDVRQATDMVISDWAESGPVDVPFSEEPVQTTPEGVRETLREVAQPAVSQPVTVRGDGQEAELGPETIASALRFEPDGSGLDWHVDLPTLAEAADPQLSDTVRAPKNADVVMRGGEPTVRPSSDGRGIDWEKSFEPLEDVLQQEQDRSVRAEYEVRPPEFSTEAARDLGINELVGEFTTGEFEKSSGVNIRRVAEQVNGAVVKPGETFSLNGHTGPRGKEQGYVESGVIEDGRPQEAVGGGISQFATTLYNASYFAGMEDVEHKEHSYFIDRYPAGRESTVFQGPDGSSVIDVKFKNVSESGIMITTDWTPESISVKLWGTKQFDVSSKTSERANVTPPNDKVVPPGEPCSESSGTPGFTVFDTRTIRDIKHDDVRTEREKTVYEPQPIIHCGKPPPPPGG